MNEQKSWQTRVGELLRETYKREGFKDVLIMIGAIDSNDNINTQIFYPADTADEFDIRFMVFALLSHLFYEYNQEIDDSK